MGAGLPALKRFANGLRKVPCLSQSTATNMKADVSAGPRAEGQSQSLPLTVLSFLAHYQHSARTQGPITVFARNCSLGSTHYLFSKKTPYTNIATGKALHARLFQGLTGATKMPPAGTDPHGGPQTGPTATPLKEPCLEFSGGTARGQIQAFPPSDTRGGIL